MRGQTTIDFLLTYGWAFLITIALIAGIAALDPLATHQMQTHGATRTDR